MTIHRGFWAAAAVLALGFVIARGQQPAAKQPYTNWSSYGGAEDSMQYSALKLINKAVLGVRIRHRAQDR